MDSYVKKRTRNDFIITCFQEELLKSQRSLLLGDMKLMQALDIMFLYI